LLCLYRFQNSELTPLFPFHCSEESKVAPPFREAKRWRKEQSERAQKAQRKRAIEKIFSQEQAAKKQSNIGDSDSETNSELDFEVGGTIRCSRYKL